MKPKRRVAVVGGIVVLAAMLVWWFGGLVAHRIFFPRDSASEAAVGLIAPLVRDYFDRRGRCPDHKEVEDFSVQSTHRHLCEGVPELPCLSYYVTSADCMFRYPVGLDSHQTYLVGRDRWLDPAEFVEFARSFRAQSPPTADRGSTDDGAVSNNDGS